MVLRLKRTGGVTRRTVVIIEEIGLAVTDDALPAWGVSLAVGTIDESAAAVNKILPRLVHIWATRVLGATNTNAVPKKPSVSETSHEDDPTYSCPAAGSSPWLRLQHRPWLNHK